jgi:preprotein translocase subunit SecD
MHRRRYVLLVLPLLAVVAQVTATPLQAAVRNTTGVVSIRFRLNSSASISSVTMATELHVLTDRLRLLGVSGTSGLVGRRSISISIPRADDTASFLAALGEDGALSFRSVLCGAPPFQRSSRVRAQGPIRPCPAKYRYKSAATGTSSFPGVDPAYASMPTTTPQQDAERPSADVLLPGADVHGAPRLVLGPSLADSSAIASAYVRHETLVNGWSVICDLTPSGIAQFATIGNEEYGQMLATDFDGSILNAPILASKSLGSSIQIAGNFSASSAQAFVADLMAGTLPIPVSIEPINS